jgi:tRNA threonylcarbamoyladenosine biosynthesis protein TsaE
MSAPQSELRETGSADETVALGRELAGRLAVGDCVALLGPLGAGKTVLVRGVAEGLGLVDGRLVSSPTYVLVHEYPARVPVYHLDLYRLDDPGPELEELGLDEMLTAGVVLIEWAARAAGHLRHPLWEVAIEPIGPASRRVAIAPPPGR